MVVIMKPGTKKEDIDILVRKFRDQGLDVGITNGVGCTILGLVGDTISLDIDKISMEPNVERVMRVQEPYKKANRKFHPEDSVVTVGKARIGGGSFSVIAGPCSVESEEQICAVAEDVKSSGAALLRGGAFKPRLPLLLPGHGNARSGPPYGGPGKDWPAHRHRDHGPPHGGALRAGGRRGPGRRPEHAEF